MDADLEFRMRALMEGSPILSGERLQKYLLRDDPIMRAHRKECVRLALAGDQSFAIDEIAYLAHKMLARIPLNEDDHKALVVFLSRIARSPQAVNAICGTTKKRGADQRGRFALSMATKVRIAIGLGHTAEEAWEIVAERNNLSPSTIKKYWMKWKDHRKNWPSVDGAR